MPVCITGMHRSGTSMVAHLLHRCGLYLGDSSRLMQATADNEGGYWENWDFVLLNDAILAEAGGSWDSPPEGKWWRREERFDHLRVSAERLLNEFAEHRYWGWKDPRTSLTLPFWQQLNGLLMPFWTGAAEELKIVLCLRDPWEVQQSLRDRKTASNSAGLDLWLTYNRSVLSHTLPENRLVTHYENYFDDAESELSRVLEFLGMDATAATIKMSTDVISLDLRHKRSSVTNLVNNNVSPEIIELYVALCEEANYHQAVQSSKS